MKIETTDRNKRIRNIILIVIVLAVLFSKSTTKKEGTGPAYSSMLELENDLVSKMGQENFNKLSKSLVRKFLEEETNETEKNYGIIVKDDNRVVSNPSFKSKYTNFIAKSMTMNEIIDLAKDEGINAIGWDNDNVELDLYWAVASSEQPPQFIMALNAGEGIKVCVIDSGIHGAHVRGIIRSNHTYHRGLAPGAQVIPYEVGATSSTMQNIEDCIEQGGEIISMSWHYNTYELFPGTVSIGYSTCDEDMFSQYLNEIISTQDIIMTAAAGNLAYAGALGPPGCTSGVVGVGMVTNSHYINEMSSVGYHVDIVAPGHYIYSTISPDQAIKMGGTSMSTPFVAGGIASLKSITGASNSAILSALYSTTDTAYCIGPFSSGGICGSIVAGNGVINVYQACLELADAATCDPYFEFVTVPRPSLPEYGDCSDGLWNQDELSLDCGGELL